MDVIKFFVGEEKYIKTTVLPVEEGETIVINDATYEILNEDYEVLDDGDAEVEDDTVKVLYDASEKGLFILKLYVKVGAETVVDICKIIVR